MDETVSLQIELPNLPYEKWLGVKQVGAACGGASGETVRRWLHEGLPGGAEIPTEMWTRRGVRGEFLLHPKILGWLREQVIGTVL